MNYELAKQLKAAGFFQDGDGFYISEFFDEKGVHEPSIGANDGDVYVPTLEELIEACEERGQLLLGCYGKGKYTARVGYFVASTPEQEAAGYPQIASHMAVESPTLIEAVAHLYLQLKKPI